MASLKNFINYAHAVSLIALDAKGRTLLPLLKRGRSTEGKEVTLYYKSRAGENLARLLGKRYDNPKGLSGW